MFGCVASAAPYRQSAIGRVWSLRTQFRLALFLSFFILALNGTPALAQPAVTATLDRDTISLGESATLSLRFEGGKPSQLPVIPAPQNLGIQYMRQSSSFQIINGQTSSSLTLEYRVVPARAGEFTIPAVQVIVDRQRLSTEPIKLRVLPANAQAPESSSTARFAFLKLIVPKTNIFVGEVLPVDIQLYVTAGEQLQIPQLQSEGFSFGPMIQDPKNQNAPRTQIGNSIYNVLSFKTAATAVKTGRLTLGPAQCSLVLHIQTQRRSRDPFEDFFEFGPRVQRQPVTLTSNPIEIEVLPLPSTNQPPSFSGAVGNYDWAVTAGPTNITTGDPITLKIQLAGEGALDALSLPQYDWREFKTYPPTTKVETTDPLGIKGVKTFEQVVVPQNADVKEIPALNFSFFDPRQKAYRTLMHPSIPLSVKASNAGQPQPTVVSGSTQPQEEAEANRDIAHIKPYIGHISVVQPALIQHPWFLALQALPILAWMAAWTWRKRQDALANNPRRRRRIEVAHTVRHGLQDLKSLADEDKAEEFFATVFRLLQEQLGERLNLPASAITESVLEDRLQALNASEELLARLHELFQACNQARYARYISSKELNSLLPKVEAALHDLQGLESTDAK